MPVHNAVVIDPGGMPDALGAAESALRAAYPEVDARRVGATERDALRRAGRDRGTMVILPFRLRYLFRPGYFSLLLSTVWRAHGRAGVVGREGIIRHPFVPLLVVAPFLQPFVSLLILLRVPRFLWRELLRNFVLSPEDPADPLVGFGGDRDAGGIMYWNLLAEKAKRYGAFGLAHDTYWGKPLSVHSWPLALVTLRFLGYRRFIGLSVLLLAAAFAWMAIASGHASILWLLPLVFVSTYFVFNLYCGTWELLSWGLAALAVASMWSGRPLLAGALVGAAILSHPGVGALAALLVSAATFAFGLPFRDLVLAGAASVPLALLFVVPYWRSRDKLGRGARLDEADPARAFDQASLYIFVSYLVLAAVAWWTSSPRSLALLALPIVLHFVNTKVVWVFSKYTVFNLVMVIGALHLALHPSPYFALAYVLVIFTSPMLLIETGSSPLQNFDLRPLRLGDTGRRARSVLGRLEGGRVAFEFDGSSEMSYATATLTYALAREPVHLLNAAYAEIADDAIFQRFVKCLNAGSTRSEVLEACRQSGTRYVVAYSDGFRARLTEWGMKEIAHESGLRLSHHIHRPPVDLSVFELAEAAALIEPVTPMVIGRNELEFNAEAGVEYRLRLSAFKGWRAEAAGESLPILDARPGMIIKSHLSGPVRLRYRYRNYFSF